MCFVVGKLWFGSHDLCWLHDEDSGNTENSDNPFSLGLSINQKISFHVSIVGWIRFASHYTVYTNSRWIVCSGSCLWVEWSCSVFCCSNPELGPDWWVGLDWVIESWVARAWRKQGELPNSEGSSQCDQKAKIFDNDNGGTENVHNQREIIQNILRGR